MFIEHHDLLAELPDHQDTIHQLKISDTHFRKLFDDYHRIDRMIRRMEQDIDTVADHIMEDAKKRRLFLKDQLYQRVSELEREPALTRN